MRQMERDVDEHQLHVRAGKRLVAAPRHRRLGEVVTAGRDRPRRLIDDAAERMVVQIPAHAGQVVFHGDACGFEFRERPYSGQEQQSGESTAPAASTTSASAYAVTRLPS